MKLLLQWGDPTMPPATESHSVIYFCALFISHKATHLSETREQRQLREQRTTLVSAITAASANGSHEHRLLRAKGTPSSVLFDGPNQDEETLPRLKQLKLQQ